jgi:undecaprenyl-diphosphatase
MKIPHKKIIKEVSFKTLLVSSLFFVAIFIFAFLAHEIVGEKEDMFDTKVFNFLKAHTTAPLVKLMNGLSFFGNHFFLIPAYILLVTVLFLRHRRSDAINIIVIVLSSTALLFGLKTIYGRHRPELPLLRELHDYSFPSGHALSSFIFCSILIYLIWKSDLRPALKYLLAGLLVIFSLSIGISRIVLRYHFASDVLAGFALGFAWVIFSFWILKKLSKRSGTGH